MYFISDKKLQLKKKKKIWSQRIHVRNISKCKIKLYSHYYNDKNTLSKEVIPKVKKKLIFIKENFSLVAF